MFSISVIVPVKNGAATLEKCLASICQQSIASKINIIILDSASTDNSKQIAKAFGVRVIDIANGTFNHGLTRNRGVEAATGHLVYFTVQDAYLSEADQLKRMSEHFQDQEVQSVTGIQGVPGDINKNPANWFKRFSKPVPEIKQFKNGSFKSLSPKERLANSRWDNVNTMYRCSALKQLPFRETDFSEDALWAMDALTLGWKIIRDSSLLVYHYHHTSFSYAYKVAYAVNYHFYKYFNYKPSLPRLFMPLAQVVYRILKSRQLSFKKKVHWISHNFFAQAGGFLSHLDFLYRLRVKGFSALTKRYNKVCKNIPQGLPE